MDPSINFTIIRECFIIRKIQTIIHTKKDIIMNSKLTTGEKLKDLRVEKNLTLEELANVVHLSVSTLSNYENDGSLDLSAVNILKLAEYYGVSTDYLLGITENRKGNLTEVNELHLDDEVIELLENEKINNRLLCEMIKDRDFIKFMIDIEIYVDGIAAAQISNLNSYVAVVSREIAEKYHPSETELTFATLEAAQIDEGYYFADRIHQDIDEIIGRIKQKHKSDDTSMQPINLRQIIEEGIKEAEAFQGSDEEKKADAYCSQLGINYHSLTPEEFQTLIRILRKSKLFKSHTSNRGKGRKK